MVETPSIPPSNPGSSPRVGSVSSGPVGVGQNSGAHPAVTLNSGSVLSGTVTASDAKGNITLETAAVKLVLQSAVALPKNAQVTVRVEQPVTSDSMPSVRILTVDGKPVSQYIQQAQQGAGQNPQNPSEVARPTAQVIEMSARPAAQAGNTPETQLQAAVNTRAIPASQLSINAVQTLPAVLLRPMVTAKTEEVLSKLAQPLLDAAGKPIPQSTPPQPPITQAMLRPGMQMQVRIMDMPPSVPTAASPAVVAPSGTPATPVGAVNPVVNPVTQVGAQPVADMPAAPQNLAQQQAIPTTPNPAQAIVDTVAQKAAYAVYAKNPAPLMHVGDTHKTPVQQPLPQPTPLPIPQASQMAVLQQGVPATTQQPSLHPATPQQIATPQQPQTAPTTAAPTTAAPTPPQVPDAKPVQATQAQPVAAQASPNPVLLSPKVVENLLTSAEGKGLPAGQMAAVVVSAPQAGAVTVQTRLGLFSIPAPQTGAAVQPGTIITWQVRQVLPSVQPTIPLDSAVPLVNAVQVGRAGSAFHELLGVIQTLQGNHAPQTLNRLIPQVGPALSAGILLFMSVVKKGDIGSWLGKELHDSIESSGRSDLLQRLGGELNALRSLFGGGDQQTQPNTWQAMFLPVMVGKDLETAQLFVKPDDKGNKEGGGGGQRFVLELDLSAFGPMQMDGLFKRAEGQNQFNLVIRTIEALPEEVKTDIYGIFESSQKATGLNGGVTFRTMPEFPVNPLEEMQTEQRGDGSILA